MFFKFSQNSQENTCEFIKKEIKNTGVFLWIDPKSVTTAISTQLYFFRQHILKKVAQKPNELYMDE